MRVSEVMQQRVDSVDTETSVRDVCRLIFCHSINGVPVCRGKKLVGFITERDILSRFYPTIQDYIEDPVHTIDFEEMEKKVSEIFALTAKDIMSRNPIAVTSDTLLLRAQSTMFIHKIGRLPIVDRVGNLVGLISKGDIFRSLVGDKLPIVEDEEYHDWLSKHYDFVVDWGKRLGNEIPEIISLFKKYGVTRVLDIGCGTGEHAFSLAKEGFEIVGVEASSLMYKAAVEKLNLVPRSVAKNVTFVNQSYISFLNSENRTFDAAIFMGSAFAHITKSYEEILAAVSKKLRNGGVTVFQIINFAKVFNKNNRFLDFNIAKSRLGFDSEFAFLEFYDPPRKKGENLTLTMAILEFDGKKWKNKDVNSAEITDLNQEDMERLLRKNKFKKIEYFGGYFKGPLFGESFDEQKSDWLNIIAAK